MKIVAENTSNGSPKGILNSNGLLKFALPMMTLILGVGTGGDCTADYLRIRSAKLVFDQSRVGNESLHAINVGVAANDLEHAKSVLKLTMKQLAACLGVSRQAIYNWRSGAHIKDHNFAKLQSLTAAADVIAAANIPMSPLILHRVFPGGRPLLAVIGSGGDGADAAKSLLVMLRIESEQRKMVSRMLAGRQSTAPEPSDYGAPSFAEAG